MTTMVSRYELHGMIQERMILAYTLYPLVHAAQNEFFYEQLGIHNLDSLIHTTATTLIRYAHSGVVRCLFPRMVAQYQRDAHYDYSLHSLVRDHVLQIPGIVEINDMKPAPEKDAVVMKFEGLCGIFQLREGIFKPVDLMLGRVTHIAGGFCDTSKKSISMITYYVGSFNPYSFKVEVVKKSSPVQEIDIFPHRKSNDFFVDLSVQ